MHLSRVFLPHPIYRVSINLSNGAFNEILPWKLMNVVTKTKKRTGGIEERHIWSASTETMRGSYFRLHKRSRYDEAPESAFCQAPAFFLFILMSFNDLEQGYGGTSRSSTPARSPLGGGDSDDDREYKTLTQRVSQQVFHINGNITSIERLVGFLGGPRDTTDVRSKLHDVTESTRELIKDSTNDIKSLAQYQTTDPRKSRQRKLEQQKLSKDFQKVLGDFQKIQRVSASKQREYVDKAKATSAMLQSQAAAEEDGLQQTELPPVDDTQRRLQIQALDNEIEYNEVLITEREGEIQGIEQGITELNEIFRDLGMLVNEQESGIQSIYGNVLNIAQNTRQAADELTTANRHQKSARKNMCCLLLIVTIVACVLALIIVVAK
ncbi:t-SNARE [Fennellomyces sp. T-0311]|nr:t-SNARE [Fennellomyces sp. T-0311]